MILNLNGQEGIVTNDQLALSPIDNQNILLFKKAILREVSDLLGIELTPDQEKYLLMQPVSPVFEQAKEIIMQRDQQAAMVVRMNDPTYNSQQRKLAEDSPFFLDTSKGPRPH